MTREANPDYHRVRPMPQCVNHRRLFKPATSIMLAILLGGAVFSAMAQANVPHPRLKKEEFKHQVEQMEDAWRLAQLNGDAQAMDKLLSEDYVGITMNGQVVTKMQQLDRIRNRQLIVTKMDVDDVKVKLIGTTAVVTSLAVVEGTSDGASVRGTYRSTRVYSRSPSGVWKITNFEATRVGQPPPPSRRNGFGHDGPYQNGQDHGGPDNTPHTPPPDSTQP